MASCVLPIYIPSCFPFDLVIYSRVSGVWDISLLPHYWIFHCRFFFSFQYKSDHCLARTILFAIPTLKVLQNLQKQLHEWLTRATASIIVVIFYTLYISLCVRVFICYVFNIFYVYLREEGAKNKSSCKNVKRVIPPARTEVCGMNIGVCWIKAECCPTRGEFICANDYQIFVHDQPPGVSKDLCTC